MSKFLSLEWFKSRVEASVENVISKRLDQLIEQVDNEEKKCVDEKPYLTLKLVNDVLTVVLNDGEVVSKPCATVEDYYAVKNACSEHEVMCIIGDPSVRAEKEAFAKEIKKMQAIKQGIQFLGELDDFTVDENSLYLTGTSRTVPQLLAEKFIEVVHRLDADRCIVPLQEVVNNDEEFQSLKRFFMWCCLNPRAEVANELYRFLRENSFRITKQGFFVALRNVVTVSSEEDSEVVRYISNAYQKIKAVWKKSPKDYEICKDGGDYSLNKITSTPNKNVLGNLQDLYDDLPNMRENRFTDDWTKTFDIRIGKVVSMPKEQCNWSTQDCAAAGLHFTANEIHYVGCGDTSVLVLINPMKVVGIGQHKGRCYEYLPIMTVPRDEATKILHDVCFDTLELDEDYAIHELESLTEKVKDGFTKESSKHEFNLPNISSHEINNIVFSLNDMKKEIKKRVSKIK